MRQFIATSLFVLVNHGISTTLEIVKIKIILFLSFLLITVNSHKTISFKQQQYNPGVITNPKTVFFDRMSTDSSAHTKQCTALS